MPVSQMTDNNDVIIKDANAVAFTSTTDAAKQRLDTAAKIVGGTDGTIIGNAGSALNVITRTTGGAEVGTTTNPFVAGLLEYSGYSPDPGSYPLVKSTISGDFSDQTMMRGQVLSDEGSFRDDFNGSSLTRTLSGSCQFNGSSTGLGGASGTMFTTEVKFGEYIKKNTDAETAWTQVDYIAADNQLYFTTNYLGTNGNTTGIVSDWKTLTPTGASLTVASSILTIASGTASGNLAGIFRSGDYPPYNLRAIALSISQRIANQTVIFGFQDDPTTPTHQACFVFDGTDNTLVKCRSAGTSAASGIQETAVTIPNGDSSTTHTYRVDITSTNVYFFIDGDPNPIASHDLHIPGPYDGMGIVLTTKNAAIVTSTNVAVDGIFWSNVDQMEVTTGFTGESIRAQPAQAPATYSAVITGLVPALLATDIATISGAAGKSIRIKRIEVSGTQTTGGNINFNFIKRSTADSGGTSTTPTAVPHDSINAAAVGVFRAYTANPASLGTAVGTIRTAKLFVGAIASAVQDLTEEFGVNNTQEIVLHGSTQSLALNLAGVTVTGGNFDIAITWTES